MRITLLLLALLVLALPVVQAQDSADVTFNVNMKVQAMKKNFTPGTDSVTIPGGFLNWLNEPPANITKTMSDADNDSIYTKVIRLKKGENYEYKFNIGLGWDGKDENTGNRAVIGPQADSTVTAWFNNEAMPSGDTVDVTFIIDMRLPAKQDAAFASRKVYVAGSFTTPDWGNGAVELTDANSDTVYTGVARVKTAQLIAYKFIHSADTPANGSWENIDNRQTWIDDATDTISGFWENKDPNVTLADGNILFQVDMSVMSEIGIYNAIKDSLRWYSSFNGWNGGGDPSIWRMSQDFSNPLLWTINVPMVSQQVGGEFNYKYFVELDSVAATMWTDGWERPVSQGGGNRDVTFEGSASQEVALAYYDDVPPDYVIPGGTFLTVTFRVDMTGATTATLGAFVPATDSLYWICEMPSFTYSQGWVDSDTMKVLRLTDANSDMIYEGTLVLDDSSFNVFEYRYAYKRGTTYGYESAGFGDNAYRVRYVGQSAARTFPVNPWTMPQDTWNDSGTQPQEADPYTSLTFVKEDGVVATTYELQQNYPNPFNPSTTIKFALAGEEHVTLRVYNLLGQEVSTLVNQELVSGSYQVKFDGDKLATGMYIYRFTAGNYVETRRMMFLK